MKKNRLETEIEKGEIEKKAIEAQNEATCAKYAHFINKNLDEIVETASIAPQKYKLPKSIKRKERRSQFLIKLKNFFGL